ncbi:RsiV family protein [Legionella micdadei]|uniref:DUF3298 domain-containing protein n=1 Tax=Legionella micdadei TaxID=451 RepID=A0A098GJP3_LEGMI|nr:RsiV family protein [Legionella micdadei]ARG96887.1 DUF3298 domain-containing protein [Legionella micdadei]KTD26570.1 endo-1,4-beta-xylanase-like protein [Legionella micdadei]NSL17839.1 DUF3298 domain-containing protein [Legionella micdadei]CEG61711.1 conserved exported protein of unknown function [Legionella micdadei]SCY21236.1 Protein of unknown function [Legionella micdadei]
MRRSICVTALIFFSICTWASNLQTVTIKKETPEMDLQIKYPQGFAEKSIDAAVLNLVTVLQKGDTPSSDAKLPDDTPGKSSLYIDYKTVFHHAHAVSLLFSISAYSRGAAHPANSVRTLNFLNGQEIAMEQLFKPKSNFLSKIAEISRATLTKKKISDNDWIKKGTEPTSENYRNWLFNQQGITIVFDTYQVAAYVYGPQKVEISKAELNGLLRPEIVNSVWGNR